MNKFLLALLLLLSSQVFSQNIHGVVTDANTGKPLPYAIIIYQHQKNFLYTDSAGRFSLSKDSLPVDDSLRIQYLGYAGLIISNSTLKEENIFSLTSVTTTLAPVTVSNCRRIKNIVLNKRTGVMKTYLGPGPETKIIIAGRYLNNKNKPGYIKQISFYDETFTGSVNVPVRLHWYEWNEQKKMPGKELTDTGIIIYPYKKGWNNFLLPANSVYFPDEGIVFGLEFIYPVEFFQQYKSLSSANERLQWLSDMNHRWSLGMQTTKDEDQTGFYSINNADFEEYGERGRNSFIKPAIRFTIAYCVK